ncbi:MAG: N-acetyltransferase [Bacteroidales bacterium]|jgi:ribosomal protein S18 acetylase RimI-like enzyme|nr:N-acetyltransferase [Bacteroidales bacterium]MDD3330956.1 N-acetyltransferase [Bacteroidales bacterium]MDD3691821.1 N-acetyltransferase [Bacteroidales bacterium]MDD4045136.1 N-acetyltransferase [Bacteroidales bacterium]MDD4581820.1 N-acetyltransferase [Bacteroidales bacterium]
MHSQLLFRKADKKDIEKIIHIERLCFDVDAFNKRQFLYLLSHNYFYVAELKNEILAYIILLDSKRAKSLRLYSIAVHPHARGMQIGQHLLDHAFKLAKSLHKEGMHLEVRDTNLSAIQFYKKNGFSFSGSKPAYYADGATATIMRVCFE